ncbi:hypothetical protein Poli38472_011202 [Pythium oligandrum]|uniref:Uncharacterized protein n=1 Tax=Pythium oligandrum TaxID=41045 RepID=A0A8K1CPV0_PYTOL|nr:hypothetical protein Poli38472_011202 [Pythium oligandrum]|eukprot:TMW67582.1 hypothetical protein Poli38472_011202 [Pythium oligandrum]
MHNMMKLAPRFQALEDRVNVYSGIIDEPSALGVTLPTVTTPEELRDLRDALLVTAALGLGVSTRDAWLQALDRQAGVYCAMELETQNPLNARYSMILGDMSHCILDWTSSMRYFFGYDEHTEYFDDDCEHVKAMIAEFEHDITKFTSIPIDLLVNAPSNWSLSDQIEYVKSIATIVRETMRQTQRAEQTHPLRPRFELKTIDLNFQTLHVTQGVAQQLQELLALDVAVKSIVLPAHKRALSRWRSLTGVVHGRICCLWFVDIL